MKKFITCALAAATFAGGLGVAGGASAQHWRGDNGRGHYDGGRYDRGRHDGWRGNDAGAALALGVIAGAALGGGRVYAQPSYGYGYYAPPPRYAYGYDYPRGYGYGYHEPRCWTESDWRPGYGRVFYRVCR